VVASRVPILTSLFGKREADSFVARRWGQMYVHRPVAATVRRLFERELLGLDVEALVRRAGRADVWFCDLDGTHRQATAVASDDAIGFHDAGHTLYLHDAQTPALGRWHRALAVELGHAADRTTFSLFAGRRTAGTRCHFDSLENITIQLRGRKRWRIAPNEHIREPVHNWVTGQTVPPSLAHHAPRGLPARMPDGAYEIDLRAGDVLYIPRGWWHETETAADSLAAFVAFVHRPWADVVISALRQRLLLDPAWRRNAIASWEAPAHREAARRELANRLAELARAAGELELHDLAPELAAPGRATRWRHNPLASLHVERRAGGKLAAIVSIHRGTDEIQDELTMPAAFAPLLAAVQATPLVSAPALAQKFARLGKPRVAHVLRALTAVGYLTPVS
jgi:hypothetical protein